MRLNAGFKTPSRRSSKTPLPDESLNQNPSEAHRMDGLKAALDRYTELKTNFFRLYLAKMVVFGPPKFHFYNLSIKRERATPLSA